MDKSVRNIVSFLFCIALMSSCAVLISSCSDDAAHNDASHTGTTTPSNSTSALGSSSTATAGDAKKIEDDYSNDPRLIKFREELEEKNRKKLDELNESIRVDPKNGKGYFNRGYFFTKAECNELALEDLNKAMAKGWKTYDAYKLRGEIHSTLNNVPEALADFTRANEMLPNNRSVLTQRGLVLMNLGKYDAALADLNKVIGSKGCVSDNKFAYSVRASLYMKLKQNDKALADFDAMLKTFSDSDGIRQRRLDLEVAMGRFKQAEEDANYLIKDNPEDATIYKVRGDVSIKLKNTDKAIADYSKAIELEPSFVKAYEARANAYLAAGKTEMAVKDRDSIKAIKEKKPEALPRLLE